MADGDGDGDGDGENDSVPLGDGDGLGSLGDGDGLGCEGEGLGDVTVGVGVAVGVGVGEGCDGVRVGEGCDGDGDGLVWLGVGDTYVEGDTDGEGAGGTDGGADTTGEEDDDADCRLGVTVQLKLTEPEPPDGYVAVTVTRYVPVAAGNMAPLISPVPSIDRPGGRPAAVNCGDCPSAALIEGTCNSIAVPAASSWLPGSSSRTTAARK